MERTLRTTSVYVLSVPAHVGVDRLLNEMILTMDSNPNVQRAAAWPKDGNAVVMFRASNDAVATRAAESMGGNTPGAVLHTGIGVNKRIVAES